VLIRRPSANGGPRAEGDAPPEANLLEAPLGPLRSEGGLLAKTALLLLPPTPPLGLRQSTRTTGPEERGGLTALTPKADVAGDADAGGETAPAGPPGDRARTTVGEATRTAPLNEAPP